LEPLDELPDPPWLPLDEPGLFWFRSAMILSSAMLWTSVRSDFATITIDYVPDRHVVELKTLKLYINKYRNRQISHESAANTILDDLISLLSPRWMRVVADFTVRGNIKTIIFAEHTTPEYQGPHPEYRRYLTA
jgi:7-cyano-7-deazaguanine reductase